MRAIISLVVLLSSVFVFSGCSDDNGAWQRYTSKEGNYAITMPRNAQQHDKVEETVFGKQATHFLTWKPSAFAMDKFKLFEISYTDCKPAMIADSMSRENVMEAAVQLKKKDFSDVDIVSQTINLNGNPGRAFFYDDPKGNSMVSVKMCIVGNKLYFITVVFKENYSTSQEMNKFFDSFQVLR